MLKDNTLSNTKNGGKKALNVTLSVATGIVFALFVVTFAIAVPILFRPFYYWNVKWLNLVEDTGYSYEMIKGGFDAIMDFLVLGAEFSAGEFAYSQSGMEHFADCKPLFKLDLIVLIVCSVLLIALFVLKKTKVIKITYKKVTPYFVSSIVLLALFAGFGLWGATDFDSLFTVFHHVCFPGKNNWYFSSVTDPIIDVLPQEFWLNCAILIFVIIMAFCVTSIVKGALKLKKWYKDNRYDAKNDTITSK